MSSTWNAYRKRRGMGNNVICENYTIDENKFIIRRSFLKLGTQCRQKIDSFTN